MNGQVMKMVCCDWLALIGWRWLAGVDWLALIGSLWMAGVDWLFVNGWCCLALCEWLVFLGSLWMAGVSWQTFNVWCFLCRVQLLPLYVMDRLSYPGVPGLFTACLFSGALRYTHACAGASACADLTLLMSDIIETCTDNVPHVLTTYM